MTQLPCLEDSQELCAASKKSPDQSVSVPLFSLIFSVSGVIHLGKIGLICVLRTEGPEDDGTNEALMRAGRKDSRHRYSVPLTTLDTMES